MKFRTNECTSMWHVWKEGMNEWKRAYEVDAVKKIIMESRGEVLDEVVQEYVKNLANKKSDGEGGKKEKRKRLEDEEDGSHPSAKPDEEASHDNDDLYYFSKLENSYKVFDPRTKTWSVAQEKPSADSLTQLRAAQEEIK